MREISVIALVTVLVALGSHFGFQLERAGTRAFWVIAVLPTAVLAGGALLYAWRRGALADWMRPVWGDATRGVVGAAVLFGAAYVIARAVAGTARESWFARLYLQFGDPKTLRENMVPVAAVIVLAAASEEIVWRGLVRSLLEEKWGPRWAMIGAAIPYALAHVPTAWALRDPEAGLNPLLPFAALGAGVVWGFMATRNGGRLVPAIVAHALFDWVVVMTFRLWGPSV